jgi:hypothetical protein
MIRRKSASYHAVRTLNLRRRAGFVHMFIVLGGTEGIPSGRPMVFFSPAPRGFEGTVLRSGALGVGKLMGQVGLSKMAPRRRTASVQIEAYLAFMHLISSQATSISREIRSAISKIDPC